MLQTQTITIHYCE